MRGWPLIAVAMLGIIGYSRTSGATNGVSIPAAITAYYGPQYQYVLYADVNGNLKALLNNGQYFTEAIAIPGMYAPGSPLTVISKPGSYTLMFYMGLSNQGHHDLIVQYGDPPGNFSSLGDITLDTGGAAPSAEEFTSPGWLGCLDINGNQTYCQGSVFGYTDLLAQIDPQGNPDVFFYVNGTDSGSPTLDRVTSTDNGTHWSQTTISSTTLGQNYGWEGDLAGLVDGNNQLVFGNYLTDPMPPAYGGLYYTTSASNWNTALLASGSNQPIIPMVAYQQGGFNFVQGACDSSYSAICAYAAPEGTSNWGLETFAATNLHQQSNMIALTYTTLGGWPLRQIQHGAIFYVGSNGNVYYQCNGSTVDLTAGRELVTANTVQGVPFDGFPINTQGGKPLAAYTDGSDVYLFYVGADGNIYEAYTSVGGAASCSLSYWVYREFDISGNAAH